MLHRTGSRHCHLAIEHCTIRKGVYNCKYLSCKICFNPLESRDNYIATSNNMKLVHWPLMGGLLYLVQRGGDWAERPRDAYYLQSVASIV